jgi:hypothetical protein
MKGKTVKKEFRRLLTAILVLSFFVLHLTVGCASEAASYLSIASGLKPSILRYNVAGNHDIHDAPSPTSYAWYKERFGDLWYSFTYGNNLFIVLESNILKNSSNYPGKDTEQMDWLTATLANAEKCFAAKLSLPTSFRKENN